MVSNSTGGGWALGQLGAPAQSTTPPIPTPQQVAQIQAMTGAMQQPFGSTSPQQQNMMSGLFNNPNGQNGMGQNLGSMGQSLWGSSPAFGGGNILSGDAFGGSAANPLAGLTAADYG
jgi:hypothetical protein